MTRTLTLALIGMAVLAAPAFGQSDPEEALQSEIAAKLTDGTVVQLTNLGRGSFIAVLSEPAQKPAKGALLIVHDKNDHPDSGLARALRVGLAKKGYATFAVQLPQKTDEAALQTGSNRLSTALGWLQEHGYGSIGLVSYNYGSQVASNWLHSLVSTSGVSLAGWTTINLTGKFKRRQLLPVYDVAAERETAAVEAMPERAKQFAVKCSRQEKIAGVDAQFTSETTQVLVDKTAAFFDEAKSCKR